MQQSQINLQLLDWETVRNKIHLLSPELAKIIDQLNPPKDHKIYQANYKYGQKIVDLGQLQLPTIKKDRLIPLSSNEVPSTLKEDLNYNAYSNPVTFTLSKSLELFIELPDRLIPYSVIPTGSLFGLSRILDLDSSNYPEIQSWGLTAGARSIFMLPSISESISFNRLRKAFYLKTDKPKTLLDQWSVFRELANHESFTDSWDTDLLFFSKHWFSHFEDKAWYSFNYYLIRLFLNSSSYWRNQYLWNLLFTRIHQKRKIKPSLFITDIAKHLLALGIGALPGFSPVIDESLAPAKAIQKLFIENYGIKEYAPILLAPKFFNWNQDQERPIYFSLQHCTPLELGMKSSDKASALTDLYFIHSLLSKYLEELEHHEGLLLVPETLQGLLNNVAFDFFHSQTGSYEIINSTQKMPKQDSAFLTKWQKTANNQFPHKGHFINGCVRISRKA